MAPDMTEEKPRHASPLYVKLPESEYCIDYILVAEKNVVLAKESDDASKITPGTANTLKTIADFLDALPIILSNKISGEKLEESIVYSRHNIPVVSHETFKHLFTGGRAPLIYFSHGGVYVKVRGKKLKELREKMGLSRGELAWRIGVSNKAIVNYEEGESDVSLDVAWKLEKLFGDVIFEEVSTESLKEIFNEKIKAPDSEPRDAILRSVFIELRSYGFKNYVFSKVPFDAGVKFAREKINVKIAIKEESSSKDIMIASKVSEHTHTPLVVIANTLDEVGDEENLVVVKSKDPRKVRDAILNIFKREGQQVHFQ